MKTVKISDKLSELLACDDVRERLSYRHDNYPKEYVLSERNNSNKVYKDAFDGERYARLVEDGHFDNKYDIALKIDIDGFRSKFSSTKLVMIHCVILNYDISEVIYIKVNMKKKKLLLICMILLTEIYERMHFPNWDYFLQEQGEFKFLSSPHR